MTPCSSPSLLLLAEIRFGASTHSPFFSLFVIYLFRHSKHGVFFDCFSFFLVRRIYPFQANPRSPVFAVFLLLLLFCEHKSSITLLPGFCASTTFAFAIFFVHRVSLSVGQWAVPELFWDENTRLSTKSVTVRPCFATAIENGLEPSAPRVNQRTDFKWQESDAAFDSPIIYCEQVERFRSVTISSGPVPSPSSKAGAHSGPLQKPGLCQNCLTLPRVFKPGLR